MKKLIRYVLYRIYLAGQFEAKNRAMADDRKRKSAVASFDNSVAIHEAEIQNNRADKKYISVGANSVVRGELMLFKHGGEIVIGSDCFIGPGSKIWSAKKITVGNRVLISHNVNIHDNNSHPVDSAERHADFIHIFQKGSLQDNIDLKEAAVTIGDDAWIGFNSIILKGVTIGKGAIIGAGTLVTDDVPDFAIVAGNPQRIIKYTT